MPLSENLMSLGRNAAVAAGALAGLPKVIQLAGSLSVGQQANLAQFSGQIAANLSALEAARMQIQQERARATEETTAQLVESQIALEQAMAPISAQLANIQNTVLADLAELARRLVEFAAEFLGTERAEPAAVAGPLQTMMSDIAAGRYREPLGKL